MTPDEMRRAADLFDEDADVLRDSHTLDGEWIVYDESDKAAHESHDEMRALAAKLRALAEATGWRDIATAPRDGTEIDVWCIDHADEGYQRVTNAWWSVPDGRWRCYTDDGLIWASQPVFWQPLPPPPQT